MKLVSRLEVKIDGFDKCHVISDQDCSLGMLYDYACSFKAFISQKIKETEVQAASSGSPDISPEIEKAE